MMENETRRHISGLLLSNKRHVRYVGLLACLALVVTFGVTMVLRQVGRAATYEETVLDCHVAGNVAHAHDAGCYDADGNLVCQLPERELHTHDDSCYTSETSLVCGLQEHTHSDACYDEEGNLACGLEEHAHSDACYETTRTLTCGKEEVTEAHQHGDGCFKTVTRTVADDEVVAEEPAEEAAAAADEKTADKADETKAASYPAQEFSESLKQRDNDGVERVVLTVAVKAPEGALPEGAEMTVSGIASSEVAALEAKIDEAVKRANGADAEVKQYQAVDIKFFDADGKEVEPKKAVEVKITSPKVNEIDDPVLVHVIDKAKDNQKGKSVDAEVVNAAVVNHNDADKSTGNEDTLKFKSDEFSPYVIVELEELVAEHLTADGKTVKVTVLYDQKAAIPEGAELIVSEVQDDDAAWGGRSVRFADALSKEYGNVTISDARFLNVAIMFNDVEVNLQAPVTLVVEYTDGLYTQDTAEYDYDEEYGGELRPDPADQVSHFIAVQYEGADYKVLKTKNTKSGDDIVETTATVTKVSDCDIAYVYEYDTVSAE